jgi:hypothetical protein
VKNFRKMLIVRQNNLRILDKDAGPKKNISDSSKPSSFMAKSGGKFKTM